MKLYCILFVRRYEKEKEYCNFFIYAKTRLQAERKFCIVTGYKNACIISVHVIE